MNSKPALALSFILAALPAQAEEANYIRATRLIMNGEPLLRCQNQSGRPVTFIIAKLTDTPSPYAYSVRRSGDAPLDDGSIPQTRGHYIVIPESFTSHGPDLYKFAVAHECSHHRLGHTEELLDNGFFVSADDILIAEREADCDAAGLLITDYNLSKNAAAQVIRNAFNAPIIREHDTPDSPGRTHDNSSQRVRATLACLNHHAARLGLD